jgi:hypothetical protein
MKYWLSGTRRVNLSDQDFVAQGGEAKLYAQGDWLYKIYHDPSKVIAPAKIQELAVLDHPQIIRPQQLLFDAQQQPVGFSMARVKDSVALPRLFTNDYRRAQHLNNADILALIEALRDTIRFIHSQGCLLVDGNEMNYLVDARDHRQPYFIDVDSYQTPSFPATALMQTIRDYHSPGFSTGSDWFAFGVVICQLWVGIHPYKGTHPDFKKHDLAARMQAQVSIFNPAVRLPTAARALSQIPAAWRDWLLGLLEQGLRVPPPLVSAPAAVYAPPLNLLPQASAQLDIQLLRQYPAVITAWLDEAAGFGIVAGQHLYLEQTQFALDDAQTRLIFSPQRGLPLACRVVDGQLQIRDLHNGQTVPVSMQASGLVSSQNQLYVLAGGQLTQLKLTELGTKLFATPGTSWQVMPHATVLLEGLLYQNVLGMPYLVLPQPPLACAMLPVPELRDYRIISGKHQGGVVMLLAYKQGRYDRLCLRLSADYRQYQFDCGTDVELGALNFVVLDNGLVIQILGDGELLIFQRHGTARKQIQDAQIRSDSQLAKQGNTGLFYLHDRLYRMSIKTTP